jgi:hypothetical protein
MLDNHMSYVEVTMHLTSPGDVSFWYKIASEPKWDKMLFKIDGSIQGQGDGYSGAIDWTQVKVSVTAGLHSFRWEYAKDSSLSQGSDAVWLDDIFFPPFHLQVPAVAVSPASYDFGNVPAGSASLVKSFTVFNTGATNLVIDAVSFSGTNASEFAKQDDLCSGQTLTPSGTCTIGVKLTASTSGAKSANLSIPSNLPEAFNVPLSGTVCSNKAARVYEATPVYYTTLQAAYNAAEGGNTMQAQTFDFTEDLVFNRNVQVSLKGGYDCAFTVNASQSTIRGSLTVSEGTVIIENISIQ